MLLIVLLSQQLLDMLGSNQKERAVLLCNYFLFHNQEAWIVVGRGIPEGKMCVTIYKYIQSYDNDLFPAFKHVRLHEKILCNVCAQIVTGTEAICTCTEA